MIELDFFLKRIRRDFFEDLRKAELYFAPGKEKGNTIARLYPDERE